MRIQTPAITARLVLTLFLVLALFELPRSNRSRIGGTNKDGSHTADKLLALELGTAVAFAVVLTLSPPLALFAAATLLDAAAEDSATKACEKLAVP